MKQIIARKQKEMERFVPLEPRRKRLRTNTHEEEVRKEKKAKKVVVEEEEEEDDEVL